MTEEKPLTSLSSFVPDRTALGGMHLGVVDQDAAFNALANKPILVNDLDVTTMNARTTFNELISTRYDGDTLSTIPQCSCGSLYGEYNVGKACDNCGTKCVHCTETDIESNIWIAAPAGVKGLINPIMWSMFAKHFTHSGCNLIEWLCNPNYRVEKDFIPALNKLKLFGFKRGLNEFHNQLDEILDSIFQSKICSGNAKERENVKEFFILHRDNIFSKYLPIPSKIAFITEETVTGTYADPSMVSAQNAIRTISSIKSSLTPMNLKQREARTILAVSQLAEYYETTYKDTLGTKEGWLRKHVFGSRLHFSARAVITSLSDNHNYDEVYLPWSLSVSLLKLHIINKLMARGLTPKECTQHIARYTNAYDPTIDDIFRELIAEGGERMIPIILQRNPTLARGSAQLFKVSRIKTDPKDATISMSVLTTVAPNADKQIH